MIPISGQCTNCKRYQGALEAPPPAEDDFPMGTDGPELFGCEAFPIGIPTEIIEQRFDHRNPHDGDQGLRFIAATRRAAEIVDRIDFTAGGAA